MDKKEKGKFILAGIIGLIGTIIFIVKLGLIAYISLILIIWANNISMD